MKATTHTLSLSLCLSLTAAGLSTSRAADLYTDSLDSFLDAKLENVSGANALLDFVDYSSFTVGATTHTIAEAPRKITGSSATRGALLRVNYGATAGRLTNLLLLNSVGGTRLSLADNFRLKFDFYLRLSPSVTLNATTGLPTNAGTTENLLWGVGYAATQPMGRINRTTVGSGAWGWLTTEGGNGSTNGADASLMLAAVVNGGRNLDKTDTVALNTYFTPAFGADSSPMPSAPANQWVMADISVSGGKVTVQYQGVGRTKTKFFENVTGNVNGYLMVGYEDPFTSNSFAPDDQWMLLDNVVVEDLTPPTMSVSPGTALVSYTGGPAVPFTYEVSNLQNAASLTISAITFGGASASAFGVANTLPLVVAPGQSATLNLTFLPNAPNGVKTGTMTIASNDPVNPTYLISSIQARRSVGGYAGAYYRLDETAGTTLADSSGSGPNAVAQVREALGFGLPSISGAADAGTAIGFLPANTSATGNYFTTSVSHSPSFSVAMWIKPAASTPVRTLFQRDYDFASPVDKIYGLTLGNDGILHYRVRSTAVLDAPAESALVNDESYHIVLTHLDEDGFGNSTAKRCRLYINGKIVVQKQNAEALGFDDYPLSPAVSSLHFASRTLAGFGFVGQMDDIHIYGLEISKEQVWQLYRSPGTLGSEHWRVQNVQHLDGAFRVTVPSSPIGAYLLKRSPNLRTWETVEDYIPGEPDANSTQLVDPNPPVGKYFYRVERL